MYKGVLSSYQWLYVTMIVIHCAKSLYEGKEIYQMKNLNLYLFIPV